MAKRAPPDDEVLRKAVRLYRIPGVAQAEVCERLGLTRGALSRARKTFTARDYPWPRDLVLACVTEQGQKPRGPWPSADELRTLASYLDFVNKDGSKAADVERMLDELVQEGILEREADEYVLRVPFP